MVTFKDFFVVVLSAAVFALVSSKEILRPLPLDFEVEDSRCLPCKSLFSQLQPDETGVSLTQDTEVHLRGEPKSGTGLMFFSVIALLENTCSFLEQAYGPNACDLVLTVPPRDKVNEIKHIRMMFKPKEKEVSKGDKYWNCPCTEITSAYITYNSTRKHDLPVDDSCPWVWQGNVVSGEAESGPCSEDKGLLHPIHVDACVADNHCDLTDSSFQSVIIRDPRASVVSAYFHLTRVGHKPKDPIDEWVIASLPNLCKRVLVRIALFDGKAKDNSIIYSYEEAIKKPEEFHRALSESLSLSLPDFIIKKSVASVDKPLDVHIGGVQTQTAVKAGFESEVKPETLAEMNSIMRHWFSEEQLAKWGVGPQ